MQGRCIFGRLLEQPIAAFFDSDLSDSELSYIVTECEDTFFLLVDIAERNVGKHRLDRIIERPDDFGQTVFSNASCLSEKITAWILDQNICVEFVDHQWLTGQFDFPLLAQKMIQKNINPFIIKYSGKSEFG